MNTKIGKCITSLGYSRSRYNNLKNLIFIELNTSGLFGYHPASPLRHAMTLHLANGLGYVRDFIGSTPIRMTLVLLMLILDRPVWSKVKVCSKIGLGTYHWRLVDRSMLKWDMLASPHLISKKCRFYFRFLCKNDDFKYKISYFMYCLKLHFEKSKFQIFFLVLLGANLFSKLPGVVLNFRKFL